MEFDGILFVNRLLDLTGCKSQKELTTALELNSDTLISKWKKRLSYPSTELLLRIAKKYNCSIDYLLGLEIKNEPEGTKDLLSLVRNLLIVSVKYGTPSFEGIELEDGKPYGGCATFCNMPHIFFDEIFRSFNGISVVCQSMYEDNKDYTPMIDNIIDAYTSENESPTPEDVPRDVLIAFTKEYFEKKNADKSSDS